MRHSLAFPLFSVDQPFVPMVRGNDERPREQLRAQDLLDQNAEGPKFAVWAAT